MSSQKGNASRSRPQKYQNRHAFKNNLHDTSHRTKFINSIDVANVCERCKQIIEWKIKYKKYKPLKAPAKCNKCDQKSVKFAYHTICGPCAKPLKVCPKCGTKAELIPPKPTPDEQIKLDAELQTMLKSLPERKRRTFLRYMNRKADKKPAKKSSEQSEENGDDEDAESSDGDSNSVQEGPRTREDLLEKLKSLRVEDGDKDDLCEFESDFDDEIESDECD